MLWYCIELSFLIKKKNLGLKKVSYFRGKFRFSSADKNLEKKLILRKTRLRFKTQKWNVY